MPDEDDEHDDEEHEDDEDEHDESEHEDFYHDDEHDESVHYDDHEDEDDDDDSCWRSTAVTPLNIMVESASAFIFYLNWLYSGLTDRIIN